VYTKINLLSRTKDLRLIKKEIINRIQCTIIGISDLIILKLINEYFSLVKSKTNSSEEEK